MKDKMITWSNFEEGDRCSRCTKPIEHLEDIGIWTLKDGTELIMHGTCVIDAWCNEENENDFIIQNKNS